MTTAQMQHDIRDLLQTVYVLAARLEQLLPSENREAHDLLDQLRQQARLFQERLTGPASPASPPELSNDRPPRLRALVVEDDPVNRDFLVDVVSRGCGHHVVATAASGPAMVREVLTHKPDLVIFDIHLPGIDGLTALHQISEHLAIAAVAVTGDRTSELLERALEDNILAYLLKPVDAQQLAFAIQLAWARFNEFNGLKSENQTLQQNLQDRKVIERAKGALIKRHRWSEQQAFRALQKTAMDRRTTMVKLAQEVLNGKDLA